MLEMRAKRRFVGILIGLLMVMMGVFVLSCSRQAQAKSLGIDLNADIENLPKTVHVGDQGQLKYKLRAISGIQTTGKVDFISNDPSILKVEKEGSWQALKPGVATFQYTITLSQKTIKELLGNDYDDLQTPTKYDYYTVTVLPNATDVYRLYNPNSGEHFYTKTTTEREMLAKLGWHDEGTSWKDHPNGIPVYRVYNPNAGDHHYTTNKAEVQLLVDHGWREEGVSFNSATKPAQPVYRLYNPNAKAGAHHYTKDANEKNQLAKQGWKEEGVSWYDD